MSLPNYLAKIKSSGMYRFTFDKSQLPAADAETMRLVIGYSEKGPFNNPVYIDNKQDFINLFGNVSKRLEKKGVFFHRMALQALSAGPILALNLKPFTETTTTTNTDETGKTTTITNYGEQVQYVNFDTNTPNIAITDTTSIGIDVVNLFDTNRFWKIDENISAILSNNNYINIAATDNKESSCSFFFRKCAKSASKQYNVTIAEWYKSLGEEMPDYLEGHENDILSDYFAEIYVFKGKFDKSMVSENGVLESYFDTKVFVDENDASNTPYYVLKTTLTNNFGEPTDALAALAKDDNSNFVGVYRGCLLPYFKDQLGSYISLDILFNNDKDTHKMIMKLDDSIIDEKIETLAKWEYIEKYTEGETTTEVVKNNSGWYNEDSELNDALEAIYLEGYTYTTITKASSAKDILEKSLGVLKEKGIYNALTNHVDSEYHYIVDTFAGLKNQSKTIISELAKEKDNCLAILNAPAMNDIISDTNFTAVNFKNGKIESYKLPSEVNGASYCAYYTPLVFGDNSVKFTVPSAALVSNNFMEKWNSRQPYYIVAGPNYGRIEYEGLIGPDYNYSKDDLDVLEPMGINCMVYVPRKGTYINSNQTAKQKPVSALSKIHVRELVIYLQNEIEKLMQNYQWELNTQTLRDTIKTKADAILEKIKANGGVYDYLNICDGTNNTPEVIDNEMIILDTAIEPARGAGKMVQRLTIHKTGGISSLTK